MIILNKRLPSDTNYSAILRKKPVKYGMQEDEIIILLDTKFSWFPV